MELLRHVRSFWSQAWSIEPKLQLFHWPEVDLQEWRFVGWFLMRTIWRELLDWTLGLCRSGFGSPPSLLSLMHMSMMARSTCCCDFDCIGVHSRVTTIFGSFLFSPSASSSFCGCSASSSSFPSFLSSRWARNSPQTSSSSLKAGSGASSMSSSPPSSSIWGASAGTSGTSSSSKSSANWSSETFLGSGPVLLLMTWLSGPWPRPPFDDWLWTLTSHRHSFWRLAFWALAPSSFWWLAGLLPHPPFGK